MRMLVFGRTGQVSTELRRLSGPSLHVTALGRDRADLSRQGACAEAIAAADADIVVNAAAYTAVDQAEHEADLAQRINADAVAEIANACAARDLPLIQLSTDYVFNGQSIHPWREGDAPEPLSVYGRTKLAGEEAVGQSGARAVILRTSWVFSAHGSNFVRTMLRFGAQRGSLDVVNNQYGGPTAAHDIAAAVFRVAHALLYGRGQPGIYHYCGAPHTTWFKFAQAIFSQTPAQRPVLVPIQSEDWPTAATRPMFSMLDCARINQTFGIEQPDWRPALGLVLSELATPEPSLQAASA